MAVAAAVAVAVDAMTLWELALIAGGYRATFESFIQTNTNHTMKVKRSKPKTILEEGTRELGSKIMLACWLSKGGEEGRI